MRESNPPEIARPRAWAARARAGLGGEGGLLAALALAIGVGAGLGAIAFRYLIEAFTEIFSGHRDPSALGHFTNPHVPFLGPYVVLIAPVLGGLLYGPLVYRFAPEARGHGVPEVMLAVHSDEGRIRGRVPVVKSLASALCIGAGGSVGREGPIVQIGSALGSGLGRLARLSGAQLRLLVACGAAGGIAATFNAPIAGVFFALELILRDFQTRSFGAVVLSSVVATAVGRLAFGSEAFLALPAFRVDSALEYPLYALLGLIAALVGIAFIRILYGSEDLADRLWRGPAWLRPAAGGLLLGALLLMLPQMYGVGYPVLEGAIDGRYALAFLLVLLIGKIVATSLTLSIGGSGGVFAPSLFMGAMLGSAFGITVHALAPGVTASAGAYGLVGMAAVFAAAGRAPITAVIIVFELTGDYSIILPLMLAVVIATGLSRVLSEDSIYTLKLRRRGIDIERSAPSTALHGLSVADAMGAPPPALTASTPATAAVGAFLAAGRGDFPVVDGAGALVGVLSVRELERAVEERGEVTVGELAEEAPELRAEQPLAAAVDWLAGGERDGLPVLAAEGGTMVGWIDHRDLLRAYAGRLASPRRALQPSRRPGGEEKLSLTGP